jgi:hypothetical protein
MIRKAFISAMLTLLFFCMIAAVSAQISRVCTRGDLDGDGWVDGTDSRLCELALGSRPGDPSWNPYGDVNCDGQVDIQDYMIVQRRVEQFAHLIPKWLVTHDHSCPEYFRPKDSDVNGDNVLDWFYESTSDRFGNSVELWGVDPDGKQNSGSGDDLNDEFFAVVFSDGTGKYFIGKCCFGNGENGGHIIFEDIDKNGTPDQIAEVTWRSEDGGADDPGSAPGRDAWEYIFDVTSWIVEIIHRDEYGNVLWQGFRQPVRWQSPGHFNDLPPVIFNFKWVGMPMGVTALRHDLTITVKDASTELPIVGATIEVAGPESRSGVTGGGGSVVFSELLVGDYTMTASASTYSTVYVALTLARADATIIVELIPFAKVIPEVSLGTIVASASMIIALVAYITVPRWRRKRQITNP